MTALVHALITREGLERLDAALAHIDAHPDEWRQTTWGMRTECNTSCCIAGWVVVQAGAELVFNEMDEYADVEEAIDCLPDGEDYEESIAVFARKLLGIDGVVSSDLFDGGNSRADLQRVRDRLAASLDGGS